MVGKRVIIPCTCVGPLAQLAERLVDVEEVTGSSPVQPTATNPNNLEPVIAPVLCILKTIENRERRVYLYRIQQKLRSS